MYGGNTPSCPLEHRAPNPDHDDEREVGALKGIVGRVRECARRAGLELKCARRAASSQTVLGTSPQTPKRVRDISFRASKAPPPPVMPGHDEGGEAILPF